jgi:hypothetical protein
MSGPVFGGGGGGGGGGDSDSWTLNGTRVELTTVTDHVSIGTASPTLTGAGDLTVTGNCDFEGKLTIGDGAGIQVDTTVHVDRDFTTAVSATGIQVRMGGVISLGNNARSSTLLIVPSVTPTLAPAIHAYVYTAELRGAIIDNSIGSTITKSACLNLGAPATEATDNYALYSAGGKSLLLGSLQVGAAAPVLVGNGDLTVSGGSDLEGPIAIGNGSAHDVANGLGLDYITPVGDLPRIFKGRGQLNIDSGSQDVVGYDFTIQSTTFTDANNHTYTDTVKIGEARITTGAGTIHNSSALRLTGAATEATDNYTLWVDLGATRLDGTLLLGNTGPDPINAGDLYMAGDLDCEGVASFGNGIAVNSNTTVRIDKDHSETANAATQLSVSGDIEYTSTNAQAMSAVAITPTSTFSGSQTHSRCTSIYCAEPTISLGSATVTVASSFHIPGAPTEGVNNYGLYCIGGIGCIGDFEHTGTNAGFFSATPAAQPAHIADPSGGATQDAEARTAINSINAMLATLGLTAAA